MNWKNNLNTKLILIVLVIVTIFLSISSYYTFLKSQTAIREEMSQYGKSISMALAVFSIENLLSWNYPEIQAAINHIGENSSGGICSIKIFHEKNLVAEFASDCRKKQEEEGVKITDDINLFRTPVVAEIRGEEKNLGAVEVILSKDTYEQYLSQKINSLIISSIFLLLGITIWIFLFLKIIILHPIQKIKKGTEIVGKGNLDYRINVPHKDEIGKLAEAFNDMAKKLKARAKSLEEEKNKTFSIIANFVDPIIVTDNQWRITLFNPAAEKVFKLSKNDLDKKIDIGDGKFSFDDFRGIIKIPYENELKEADKNGQPLVEEVTINPECVNKKHCKIDKKSNSNSLVYKVLTASVKDEQGQILGYMKMFYDLTREKAIDQMKNEFISISAHQLRTPLSAIKWSLQMVLNQEMGKIEEEVKKYLLKTYTSNERMIKLVNDLLDVSRIEEGRFLYNQKLTSIEDLISKVVKAAKFSANKKKINIIIEKPDKPLPKIKVDPEKMRLSFDNLLDNAIKYSIEGSDVKIKMEEIKKEREKFIQICFKDSGIGITKKDQDRLFTKFFRAENATRLQTEGSGLGLFIVKNIVQAHGGTITCESEENRGSKFCIELPANSGKKSS